VADETLRDRVSKLEASVPAIHTKMGVMDERTSTISTKTDGLFRAFYGYDKTPGLLHDVSNLIEKMDDLKRYIWIVIGLVTTLVIGGLYEILTRVPVK
jgi:hypothetical protein